MESAAVSIYSWTSIFKCNVRVQKHRLLCSLSDWYFNAPVLRHGLHCSRAKVVQILNNLQYYKMLIGMIFATIENQLQENYSWLAKFLSSGGEATIYRISQHR